MTFLCFRSLENILDSKSTLSSLAHLLSQIPNIVISDEIGAQVHAAHSGRVSKAQAKQRAGMVGRESEATFYRLQTDDCEVSHSNTSKSLEFPTDLTMIENRDRKCPEL